MHISKEALDGFRDRYSPKAEDVKIGASYLIVPLNNDRPHLFIARRTIVGVGDAEVVVASNLCQETRSFFQLGIGGHPEDYLVTLDTEESRAALPTLFASNPSVAAEMRRALKRIEHNAKIAA